MNPGTFSGDLGSYEGDGVSLGMSVCFQESEEGSYRAGSFWGAPGGLGSCEIAWGLCWLFSPLQTTGTRSSSSCLCQGLSCLSREWIWLCQLRDSR